jgi:hypothetical protein
MMFTYIILSAFARRDVSRLVPAQEARLRLSQERAQRPIWRNALETGAGMATGTAAVFMVQVDAAARPFLPAAIGAGFFIGLLLGTHNSIAARRSNSPQLGEPQLPLSMPQAAVRHYLGYVCGLAAGLVAASLVEDRILASISIFSAFLVVKFLVDVSLPSEAKPKLKPLGALQRVGYVLIAIPFGIVWWGIPIAALAVLIAHTYFPVTAPIFLWKVFATISLSAGILSSFAMIGTLLLRLVPEFDE